MIDIFLDKPSDGLHFPGFGARAPDLQAVAIGVC
jgi:hypothetical protein